MTTAEIHALESPMVATSGGADGTGRMGRDVDICQLQLYLLGKDRNLEGVERWISSLGCDVAKCLIPNRKIFSV